MTNYHYTFAYKGYEVTITILARNKHVANRLARQRELTWRAAIEARLKEHAPWS